MKYEAVIFDLDETLIPENEPVEAAFAEMCLPAVAKHGVDATALSKAFRSRARELWFNSPHTNWCKKIGLSSWEGLSGDFSGDSAELSALREWIVKSQYRRQAWQQGLADFGIEDEPLAESLAGCTMEIRNKHRPVYPDTIEVLEQLQGKCRLAILTNGAPGVQRNKLEATGLIKYFDSVTISGEVGIGKPALEIFRITLESVNTEADKAVMIGDSLTGDITGANNAGISSIWMNRRERPLPDGIKPTHEVTSLTEVLNLI